MSTNANVFNSRVTSEALEAKFRQVFPAQAGAELIQDLYASGVIQPVIDFSSVAEGSFLPEFLQTAWDFSTGSANVVNTTTSLISNTGFWLLDLNAHSGNNLTGTDNANIFIDTGFATKKVWAVSRSLTDSSTSVLETSNKFVVFLRTGDTLKAISTSNTIEIDVWWRQVADVNGNLVNPLGFTFS